MPPWLILTLLIAGAIVWTALLAGGSVGDWRTVWTVIRGGTLVALILAAVCAVAAGATLLVFRWTH